jgi:hypothetical protein
MQQRVHLLRIHCLHTEVKHVIFAHVVLLLSRTWHAPNVNSAAQHTLLQQHLTHQTLSRIDCTVYTNQNVKYVNQACHGAELLFAAATPHAKLLPQEHWWSGSKLVAASTKVNLTRVYHLQHLKSLLLIVLMRSHPGIICADQPYCQLSLSSSSETSTAAAQLRQPLH